MINKQKITPLETYPGRKGAAGAWQKIISEIPKCERFIEAMCGSSIISSLVSGCQIIINDIDASVIDKINCTAAIVKENKDYRSIIDKYDYPGAVLYFDPPYMMQTRSYKKNIYKHDWDNGNHYDFLHSLLGIKQPVILSHYPCSFYDNALKTWRKISYNSMTRAGVRVENLYMNFPPPLLLQCYNSIGKNYTDRQRIKRKVARLVNRLKNEPAQERAAILTAVIDNFNYTISGDTLNNLTLRKKQ